MIVYDSPFFLTFKTACLNPKYFDVSTIMFCISPFSSATNKELTLVLSMYCSSRVNRVNFITVIKYPWAAHFHIIKNNIRNKE